MSIIPFLLMVYSGSEGHGTTGSLKDGLQGFMTEEINRRFTSLARDITKSIEEFKENVEANIKRNSIIIKDNNNNRSVVYTGWGKKTCPSHAELVHSGYVGGSHYKHHGAAVEPLCLPEDPEWGAYTDWIDGQKAYIYGAEYQTQTYSNRMRYLHDRDVPCAVCLIRQRSSIRMFPARKTCYTGWRLEYHGYLMAGRPIHPAGSTYTCVDEHPETLPEDTANMNGYLFYQVEVICGSLKCPPYFTGGELVCAVCSKE